MSETVVFIGNGDSMQVASPTEVFVSHEAPEMFVLAAGAQGPAGPKGDAGDQGPQGLPGLSGANYIHTQTTPAALWAINHNLNRRPSVTIIDSAGSVVFGDVDYVSDNIINVTFSAAFGGSAYLN